MKLFLSLVLSIVCVSVTAAQTPSEKLFSKYRNNSGVSFFVSAQPPVKDTIGNAMVATVVTELTVNAATEDDDEKGNAKVYARVKKDCRKLFSSKEYVVLQHEQDSDETFTVYKYAKNGVVEMCVLTIGEQELTVESTKMSGLSPEAIDNFKFTINRVKM